MPEYIQRRSALAEAYREGSFGAALTTPGVSFAERRPLEMVQVATWGEPSMAARDAIRGVTGVMPPETPNRVASGETASVLWVGPGRWLIVHKPDGMPRLMSRLREALPSDLASVIDLGESRSVIRAAGPKLRDVLAQGTGIDLHRSAFPPGACAQTMLGHINALLHAVDDTPTIDIYVARSFALTFWEWLMEAAAASGYRVDPAS
jgi:sarcosine oxidase, subunit gamma